MPLDLSKLQRCRFDNAFSRINSGMQSYYDSIVEQEKRHKEMARLVIEAGEQATKQNEIKMNGAKASIELLEQTKQQVEILNQQLKENREQNELLEKQLNEQKTINDRLKNEFMMGAREAIKARNISYFSLMIGVVSIVVSILITIYK